MAQRLIDANALIRALTAEKEKYSDADTRFFQPIRCGFRNAMRLTHESPVIDAIEVVRCKDCKHWGTGWSKETDYGKVCEFAGWLVGANGYCVYGEVKENEAD